MSQSNPLRVAMLSTIAWRTPPRQYGPWEKIVSSITEGLVKRGVDVTLFATRDAVTNARLEAIAPHGYREDSTMIEKIWDPLHVSHALEHASQFDIIHSHFDFLPLTYTPFISTPMMTTIHGFSSPAAIPVFKKYNDRTHYVSISNANRHPSLTYAATVYHGIDIAPYVFELIPKGYLLFFGRIHPDKGVCEAIEVAKQAEKKLIIAGLIADEEYFATDVQPHIDNNQVFYVGNVDIKAGSELLGGAAALLHMINFDEPFGLSVVEAMACGTPVIAINRGSMSELIIDQKTGFLVSSVEEAVQCVQKIGDINRADCRRHVEEQFTVERMVDDYLRLYHQIVSQQN